MKRIFDKNDNQMVRVEVYRDDNTEPVFKGNTIVKRNSMLSFTVEVAAFLGEEAEYGDLCKYRIALKPYKRRG